jgi:hypothetical protein
MFSRYVVLCLDMNEISNFCNGECQNMDTSSSHHEREQNINQFDPDNPPFKPRTYNTILVFVDHNLTRLHSPEISSLKYIFDFQRMVATP